MVRWLINTCLVVLLVVCPTSCRRAQPAADPNAPTSGPAIPGAGATRGTAKSAAASEIPDVDVSNLPVKLQVKIGAARQALRSAPDDTQKLLDLAALYYTQGFPQVAVPGLRRASDLEPNNFVWFYCLGRAYDEAGEAAPAIAAYEKALTVHQQYLKEHPQEVQMEYQPAHVRLATLLLDKEPERAAEHLRHVLEFAPADPTALAGLGRIALAAKRYDEAAEHFRHALAGAPRYFLAHAGLAAALQALGKTEEAARHEQQASGNQQWSPLDDPLEMVMLRKGLRLDVMLSDVSDYVQRGAFDRAERVVQLAREVDTEGKRTRYALGLLLLGRGKGAEAVRELRSLVTEFPDFTAAKSNLALALAATDQFADAERLLREILDQHPTDTLALDNFCQLAIREKKPQDALEPLNRALAAAPDDANLHMSVADLLLSLEKPTEAAAAARKAVELAPDSMALRYALGSLLYIAGDLDGAEREWTEILRTFPDHIRSRMGVVTVLMKRKDYAGVDRVLRAGLEHRPNSAELLNSLAWVLCTCPEDGNRKGEEAVRLAEKANLLSGRTNASYLDTLAAAFAEVGRFDDARKTADEAIRQAQIAGRADLVQSSGQRKAFYERNKPYRETE
jgi:tetratricopeptide (TPR) repeat protein